MSLPMYPPPAGMPRDPGSIPLRPLTVGDLLGVGLGVVRRHLRRLGPVAVAISVISAAVTMAILSGAGSLESFASGAWFDQWRDAMASGKAGSVPTGVYVALGVSSWVTVTGTLLLSGIAAACVGADAVSVPPDRGLVAARLRGTIPSLVVVSAAVAVAVLVGSLIFIVPGILAYAAWAVAGPVCVMESAPPSRAAGRAARLSRGNRLRIVGVTVLIVIITSAIDTVVSSVVVTVVSQLMSITAVTSMVLSSAVGAVVAAVTTSWVAAVIALLYLDLRLRRENLAAALRAYAAGRPGIGGV